MTAEQLWDQFTSNHPVSAGYNAWAFGAAADELAEPVVQGIKTATASAYPLYEIENCPLPDVGGYNVILNAKDEAVCITQTTKVYVLPFHEVSGEHARKEGEGDLSREYWRTVHRTFFSDCLKEVDLTFDENMMVVCEEFEIVFTP